MSADTSKSPDKGSERPWLTQEVDEDFEKFYNEQIRPHLAEGLDPLTKTGFIQMCEAGWKARGYYAALASVPRLEGTPDLTPTAEDYKIAWQMQHPNAMGANWPGIRGNPYPPLADLLCCKRMLEEARAEIAEQRGQIINWEEREAAVCPEDQTFEETITVLRASLATAEEAGVRKALRAVVDQKLPSDGSAEWAAYNNAIDGSITAISALLSGEGTDAL